MLSHEQKTFSNFQKITKTQWKAVMKCKKLINQKTKYKNHHQYQKKKIQALINNASDINYMNSQLQQSLEIKKKEWKQLLIMKNAKWNEITKIIKEIEETNMNVVNHQKQIMFSKMKMSEHKIMLEMNWLWWHNSRIDWKQKKVMMKNCKCKIRQTQTESWMKIKKQI